LNIQEALIPANKQTKKIKTWNRV